MHHYGVLGPLEVDGSEDRAPQRPFRRRLLSICLLAGGRRVSREVLIDRMWGDRAPATAVNTLQAHVSALRRLLGADALVLEPGGYRLVHSPADLDAVRFEEAVSRARAHRADAHPREALGSCDEALALWRGSPYADLGDDGFAQAEIVRLTELREVAEELRAAALVESSRYDEAATELESLVREHPHRERLWEHLMLARYLDGRQADALAAYQRARGALLELGLLPGEQLQRVEQRILSQDPTLGRGDRDGTKDLGRAGLVRRRTGRGLHDWPLVGRGLELAAAERLLEGEEPGLVLSGGAGVGKSRLLHAVEDLAEQHDLPTLWLRANESLTGIPFGAASHLMPPGPAPAGAQLEVLLQSLSERGAGRTLLLLVDDAHHLDGPMLGLITTALQRGLVRVAATVRSSDEVPAEVTRWWTDVGLIRLTVGPLEDGEVDELLGLVLGEMTSETRRQLSTLAAGNPMHLREVVRAGQEEGSLLAPDGRWQLHGPVAGASRLTELVGGSLRRLGPGLGLPLELLSVTRPLAVEVLEAVAGVDTIAALDHRGLIRLDKDPADVLVADVVHPLYAENVVVRMTEDRRSDLARRLAEALAERGFPGHDDVLRAATLRLEIGDLDADLAVRAAEEALLRLDAALACRLAEIATDGPPAWGAWFLRGRAAYYLGKLGQADDLLVRAGELASTDEELVRVASERATVRGFGMRDPDGAVAILDEAIARVGPARAARRLRVERALMLAMTGQLHELVLEARALRDLAMPDDARLMLAVSSTLAGALTGRVQGVVEEVRGHLALAEDLRTQFPLASDQLRCNESEALAVRGDMREALGAAREQDEDARARGGLVTLTLAQLVNQLSLAGHVRDAALLGEERATDMAGPDPFRMAWLWRGYLAVAQVQAGMAQDARSTLEPAVRDLALAEPRTAVWWRRAEAWLALPDIDRAVAQLHHAGQEAIDGEHVVWGVLALYDVVRLGRPELVVDDITRATRGTDGAMLVELLEVSSRAHAARDAGGITDAAAELEARGFELLAADAWAVAALHLGRDDDRRAASRAVRSARALAGSLGAATPALTLLGLT